jgi:hypothetical protein
MAHQRRNRKPEGAATPPPEIIQNHPTESPLSQAHGAQGEEGLLSLTELVVGSLVIVLLLVTAIMTLRVTQQGTVENKKKQQAMDLAKGMEEQLKEYMTNQNWNNLKVDVRFPATQTPAVAPYNSYAPTTVTEGNNKFILDPEVRYVFSDSSNQTQFIPTPGNASTPEVGNLIRIRVDCFYGPLAEYIPLPTAEPVSQMANREVYTNYLANKTIYVNTTGLISGYVEINCSASTPSGQGVVVGLFQGAALLKSVVTDLNSYFEFDNVPQGIYYVETTSSPGYDPVAGYGCAGTNEPMTLTGGTNLTSQNLGIQPIPVVNYWGYVVESTPSNITPVPPSFATITPIITPPAAPVSGVVVFNNDGNSAPTTTTASGAYTITQVRATPVAGKTPYYDTLEGDYSIAATPIMGQNYNYELPSQAYLTTVNAGSTYIGPITIFLTSPIGNTMSTTFISLDADTGSAVASTCYPMTIKAADGTAAPPAVTLTSPVTVGIMNVAKGAPNVSVNLANNNPPYYLPFNQSLVVDNSVTAPLTLLNFAVGQAAGTICGMGASFDYTQFTVTAKDSATGQYVYQLPVVYDGVSTFGTFNYSYMRTPESPVVGGGPVGSSQDDYVFSANSGDNFSSTQILQTVYQGKSTTLTNPIVITALNVYLYTKVTYNSGTAYPYGAWISAVMVPAGQTPQPVPTAGQGSGTAVNDYFSATTQGDGTANIQVQLSAGVSTLYEVTAQITNPTSFAVTQKTQAVTVGVGSTQASPTTLTFSF